jgi:thiamine-phosphate pyrophosphorylase
MAFDLLALVTAEETPDPAIPVALLNAGLPCLHLRSLTLDRHQFSEYLSGIPEAFHPRIVIHTHYDLARTFKIRGIHFTEQTKANKSEIVSHGLFEKYQLSASFHSLADLASNDFSYSYVFLSPVFDSISKEKYKSSFSQDALSVFLQEYRSSNACKVYALGGIRADNLTLCKNMGFDGAALYGALWLERDPVQAWKNLLAVSTR